MGVLSKYYRTLLPAAMGAALLAPLESASAAKPYYEGKTITILLGVGPGSGGTTLARLYAKHLAEVIPGKPNVIVKNMPGAGFMKAHHYIMNSAPKDGTVIYYGPWKPLAVLLKQPGHNIKYTDYTILGGITLGGLVLYSRKDAVEGGANSAIDLTKGRNIKYGGSGGPAHVRFLIAAQTLDLLGLNWKPITSYKSNGQSRAAVIKGEVKMSMEPLHGFNNRLKPQLIDTGKGFSAYHIPLPNADGSLASNPLTPDIPSFMDVYKKVKGGTPSGPTWDAFKWLLNIEQNMVHLFFGPPNMEKEPTDILHKYLVPALSTVAFQNEAKKVLTFAPIPGGLEEATKAVKRASTMKPEVFSYIKAYVAKNSK